MADLLGSLLPADYAAPDVQSVLEGTLLSAACNTSGNRPTAVCPNGSNPQADCGSGTKPFESRG